jgi:hypothetical protein
MLCLFIVPPNPIYLYALHSTSLCAKSCDILMSSVYRQIRLSVPDIILPASCCLIFVDAAFLSGAVIAHQDSAWIACLFPASCARLARGQEALIGYDRLQVVQDDFVFSSLSGRLHPSEDEATPKQSWCYCGKRLTRATLAKT